MLVTTNIVPTYIFSAATISNQKEEMYGRTGIIKALLLCVVMNSLSTLNLFDNLGICLSLKEALVL